MESWWSSWQKERVVKGSYMATLKFQRRMTMNCGGKEAQTRSQSLGFFYQVQDCKQLPGTLSLSLLVSNGKYNLKLQIAVEIK